MLVLCVAVLVIVIEQEAYDNPLTPSVSTFWSMDLVVPKLATTGPSITVTSTRTIKRLEQVIMIWYHIE